jgi:trk system potassium uptake protein TrkA
MARNKRNTQPIAVLGLGRFGQRIAKQLARSGEEVIACDLDRAAVEAIAGEITHAVVIDVTDEQAMRSHGIDKVKIGIVAIGEHFEASVLATVILKQMEVPRIIARARTRTTGKVLERVGADDIVLAEDEAADRWASRILGPRVLSQIEFHEGYSIVEFSVPGPWVGKGLGELDVRRKHGLHIVAIKRANVDEPSSRTTCSSSWGAMKT